MRSDEIAVVLTWANQNDGRITIDDNDVRYSQWEAGLSHVQATVQQVSGVITDYYANAHPADNGYLPPVTPQIIRKRLNNARETAQAQRSAIEAPQRAAIEASARRERVKRSQTPEYKAAVIQGSIDHLEDLERRQIIKADQQVRLDEYRATGTYKPPTDGRGMR